MSQLTTASATTLTPDDPNYTELLPFAELDALIEFHGHLRGELSRSVVLINDIASDEIRLQARRWGPESWEASAKVILICACIPNGSNAEETRSWPHTLPQAIKQWESDFIPAALSRLRQGARRLLVRSTEVRARVQDSALAGILKIVRLVAATLILAICSTFISVITITIIIRVLMAHRNSREPAYYPISRLPLYQSLAGAALAF